MQMPWNRRNKDERTLVPNPKPTPVSASYTQPRLVRITFSTEQIDRLETLGKQKRKSATEAEQKLSQYAVIHSFIQQTAMRFGYPGYTQQQLEDWLLAELPKLYDKGRELREKGWDGKSLPSYNRDEVDWFWEIARFCEYAVTALKASKGSATFEVSESLWHRGLFHTWGLASIEYAERKEKQ